jgi:hypothetical protein
MWVPFSLQYIIYGVYLTLFTQITSRASSATARSFMRCIRERSKTQTVPARGWRHNVLLTINHSASSGALFTIVLSKHSPWEIGVERRKRQPVRIKDAEPSLNDFELVQVRLRLIITAVGPISEVTGM